jgi:hypothetical protein
MIPALIGAACVLALLGAVLYATRDKTRWEILANGTRIDLDDPTRVQVWDDDDMDEFHGGYWRDIETNKERT